MASQRVAKFATFIASQLFHRGFERQDALVPRVVVGGQAGKVESATGESKKGHGLSLPKIDIGQRLKQLNLGQSIRQHLLSPWVVLPVLASAVALASLYEIKTSHSQSLAFSKVGRACNYSAGEGASPSIRFPAAGPYDERLGYAAIPSFVQRLREYGFVVERQARLSPAMTKVYDLGLNVPYGEKQQAGIRILDRNDKGISQSVSPWPVYSCFDSIPGLLVKTLSCIEDQNLLDPVHPRRNPVVEWNRLFMAMVRMVAAKLGAMENVPGASTLATQMEKYRHSPKGLTESSFEKVRQMLSASLRVYRNGENTLSARRDILLNYINTAPLGAFPGYGEVFGLGEGLRVWYGASVDSVNAALNNPSAPPATKARYFRMALSLLVAHRRPEYYLAADTASLRVKTDQFLHLLLKQGIVSDGLYEAALRAPVALRSAAPRGERPVYGLQKVAHSIRDPLLTMLAVPSVYELDHLDLTARSTLDSAATAQVIHFFTRLKEQPAFLDSLGLRGFRMLEKGDPSELVYSLNLFERRGNANVLRIQADSYNAAFDFNSGVKLDLGSTAKLRTLVTYLEVIEELHRKLSPLSREELSAFSPHDVLSAWAKEYLMSKSDRALTPMLAAALDRRYSANPGEGFFTGGGLHTFGNFDSRDNGRVMPVREALQFSVNLVFIRLMRDIVNYYVMRIPGAAEIETDSGAPSRERYLDRFVEYESGVFMARFYQQLKKVPTAALPDTLVADIRSSPGRLAAIYCTIEKKPTREGLENFLQRHGVINADAHTIQRLFDQCAAPDLSLSDRGFIAGIHPLKLWTASFLAQYPQATFHELKSASAPYLHGVYRWIYSPKRRAFQKSRIRIMLEMEAFESILQSWQKQGYPFAELVPSYATALGASADRPSALAQLAGIIQNDGMKYPERRIEQLQFAAGTPYETVLQNAQAPCSRAVSVDVARAVRSCMLSVVNGGTAARARKAFDTSIVIGGKTGTGDHRQRFFGLKGQRIGEKVISRSGVFVFILGDRFFGTICAAVTGPQAGNFSFTSAYPVQLFVCCAPILRPLLEEKPAADSSGVTAEAGKKIRNPKS